VIYVLVLGAGVVAGFINTLAGGGSLVTLPLLIFMGLPSATANGTNRVALLAQNIMGTMTFRKKGVFYPKLLLWLGIPATLGSVVGSNLAINLADDVFNRILGVIMVLVLVLIITEPQKRWLKNTVREELGGKTKIIGPILFFFVGIYGGFIQAGIGFVMILALSMLTGLSLVQVNSIKVGIIAMYTSVALVVFFLNGHVQLFLGLFLAVGNSLGAFLGSHFAMAKGEKAIRIVIALAMFVMAGKLFGWWL